MSANKVSWWRRRLNKAGRERGMVEAGIAAAGGLLVVGAVVGNGVAASAMDMSDGQTWLGGNDGSVVQINPATGQPEFRLVIGGDGDAMEVTQNDGLLVVTNLETGVVTSIDLAGLIAGSGRQTDGETTVLIGGGHVMLAEMEPGFVQVVDPLTMQSLGAPYRAGDDLSDAVIDDEGTVWLMTETGELRELDWVEDSGEFSVSLERPVAGAGPQTRLVPHSSGVTVFAPDGGAVLQIGVGGDYVQQVPALQGAVEAARTSPADLVPASASDAGLVFMISGRQLLTVDVASVGCTDPLRPAVFERRVYVPCGGEGRVIVLDESGHNAGPDIIVPGGGDPELTVDDGRLVVHDPEDGRIVIVQQDGSTTVTDLAGAEVPTTEVGDTEPLPPISTGTTTPPPTGTTTPPVDINPPLPPDPTTDPTNEPTQDPTGGTTTDEPTGDPTGGTTDDPGDDPTGGSTDDPTGNGGSTDGTDGDPDKAPSGVSAVLQPDDSVELTWTPAVIQPDSYLVTSSDGAVTQTVAADQTSLTLTALTCGTTVRLTVYGQHGEGMVGAGTDVETAACVNPPEPADLTPGSVVAARADNDIVVGWGASTVAPDRYVITGMGRSVTVAGDETSVTLLDVACGDPIEFEVTAVHTDAGEYSATSASTTETCPVDPADLQPRNVTLTRVSGNSYRLTWQAPVIAPDGYTVTGNGVNQPVAVGTNQLDVTIPCVATVRLTVTADHPDGVTSQVQSNQLTNTCTTTTTPPPTTTTATLTAPTNVTATKVDDNTVRVTWSASSPGAQEYVVIPSAGGTVSTTDTFANIDVTPGASYFFTVEARWQTQTATSAASNSVNMPAPQTVPSAPPNFHVDVVYINWKVTNYEVTWTAPDDGGSPLTGYQLTWDGQLMNLGPGTTSWSDSVYCTSCGPGVPVFDVTLSATNALGQSPLAYPTFSEGPAPAPPPQEGDSVISLSAGNRGPIGEEGNPWSLTYNPPSAWASFTGTCTAYWTVGFGGSTQSQVIACGSTATLASGEAIDGVDVSAYVVASGEGISATSATGGGHVMGRNELGWCSDYPVICYDPQSLPLGDPDVEIDPLPWTPPEPPNPPVLIAGVGLLVGAGTMRTLRALRRRGLFEVPAESLSSTASTSTERPKDDHR